MLYSWPPVVFGHFRSPIRRIGNARLVVRRTCAGRINARGGMAMHETLAVTPALDKK